MPRSFNLFRRIWILVPFLAIMLSCKKESAKDSLDLESCNPVTLQGKLTRDPVSGKYSYLTTGGATITLNPKVQVIITHKDYAGFKLEFWGYVIPSPGDTLIVGNHENLNGKHIKDRIGTNRSILFPDGTKLTMRGLGWDTLTVSISIIEGKQVHHLNGRCGKWNISQLSEDLATQLDEAVADGETCSFEISGTGLLFVNIYQEDTPGNKVFNRVILGELERASPSLVRDFYDDPRFGHT